MNAENENNLVQPAVRAQRVENYYFSDKLQQLELMRSQGAKVINLGIGSPDLPPHPAVIEKLSVSAADPFNHGYQSYKGTNALREAFASWYKRKFDVELNFHSEILPLMGSKEGIMHISLAFLDLGDQVLIPDPGYPTYSAVCKIVGAQPVYYELEAENNWMPDLKALATNDLSKVKLMWVNYPHMPSGATATKVFFEELIAFGKQHHILICNDNPYALILNETPLSILSTEGSKTIALELNSLSKSHNMPGWRMGMVCGHQNYINQILKIKSNMDSGMFKPLQDAAVEALMLDENWTADLNMIYADRKRVVHQIYDAIGCSYEHNQSGLFVWAKIPAHFPSAELLSEWILHETEVFITPGFIFGKQGRNYLRISLCCNKKQLLEALIRIENLMKSRV